VPFLREVLRNIKVDVYVGGGVRDIKDLMELKDVGVCGVLVATALHSGKISLEGKDVGVCGVLVATALHSGKISLEGLKQAGLL